MSGFLGQHKEITSRLDSAWNGVTPISFPNVNFTPPNPQDSWIALHINDGASQQISIGALPAVIRYTGVIYVQVFTVRDIGSGEALALADAVKNIFNNWCGVNVRCYAARIKTVGVDDNGWFQVNVSIPFIRDEQL